MILPSVENSSGFMKSNRRIEQDQLTVRYVFTEKSMFYTPFQLDCSNIRLSKKKGHKKMTESHVESILRFIAIGALCERCVNPFGLSQESIDQVVRVYSFFCLELEKNKTIVKTYCMWFRLLSALALNLLLPSSLWISISLKMSTRSILRRKYKRCIGT